MNMSPRIRKLALTAHVTASVGWLGAVVAYLPLALTALSAPDAGAARSAFLSMELIGWRVIVPLSVAALLTGLVQSLGTPWGLLRYYWVLTKFLLTVFGSAVLLAHMRTVSRMSAVAAGAASFGADVGALRHPTFVVHAAGGLLVLLTATMLSVYKPWGMTRYGLRKRRGRREEAESTPPGVTGDRVDTYTAVATLRPGVAEDLVISPTGEPDSGSRRRLYILLGGVGLLLLFVGLHLAGVVGPTNK
jgi:hypothetical protein